MSAGNTIYIVYDGECPFCSNYVQMLRLRESLGDRIELVDARQPHEVVDRLRRDGVDLDEGMAIVDGDRVAHGDECLHQLALMSTGAGWFNRLNARIFRNPSAARLLYPALRLGRNMTLRLLGRRKISERRAEGG